MDVTILFFIAASAAVYLVGGLFAVRVAHVHRLMWRGPWSVGILAIVLALLQRLLALLAFLQRRRVEAFPPGNADLMTAAIALLFSVLLVWSAVRVVALAAVHRRQEKEATERAAQLKLINRISFLISSAVDLDEILRTLVDELARALRVDLVALALMDADSEYAEVVAEHLPPGGVSAIGDRHPVRDNPIAQQILRSSRPVVVSDVATDPRLVAVRQMVQRRGTRSLLVAPLIYENQIIGTVGLDAVTAPRVFTPADVELVQTVANYAAIAIGRSRLLAIEQERLRMATVLSETAAILTSTLAMDRVLELVLDNLKGIVPYHSSAIFLRQGDWLELTAGRGFPDEAAIEGFSFEITDSALESMVTQEGRPMIIPDVRDPPLFRRAEGTEYIRSWIGAPLWARGKLVGLLTVDHAQPNVYTAQDAHKVMGFANQAAIVIENARLFEEQVVLAEELEARNNELLETQQKLIEAERLAVIGQVGLTMRHEINNPLTSVMGLAQWISHQHPELPADVLADLETIERMAVRIRDIVSKLGDAKYRTVTVMENMTMLDLHDRADDPETE